MQYTSNTREVRIKDNDNQLGEQNLTCMVSTWHKGRTWTHKNIIIIQGMHTTPRYIYIYNRRNKDYDKACDEKSK